MPVGGTSVANEVQTSIGYASGVVADVNSGYGIGVAGAGVVDLYQSAIPPGSGWNVLLSDGTSLLSPFTVYNDAGGSVLCPQTVYNAAGSSVVPA